MRDCSGGKAKQGQAEPEEYARCGNRKQKKGALSMISKAKDSIDSRPKLQSQLTLAGISDNSPDPNPLTKPGKKLQFRHYCCIAMVLTRK
jgi:hypothetical protein